MTNTPVSLGIPVVGGLTAPLASSLAPAATLGDQFGRRAADMRLSLTDKCNLRCTYCMPEEGLAWLTKDKQLTLDEILRLVRLGVDELGIRELRLTGGEPLVRSDLVEIIANLRKAHPQLPISLTTNGVGLSKKAQALADAGLSRINISLDTLHPEAFKELTRRPLLDQVLAGVDAAIQAKLTPVKINAVLMRGINDHHASELLSWSLERGIQLRFIEQMPLDADHGWSRENMITASEIRQLLSEDFKLTPHDAPRNGAPAELFSVESRTVESQSGESQAGESQAGSHVLGTVGIIASVTEPFCSDCTRTRITAEGKVMSCLFSHTEVDLLQLLRAGDTNAHDAAVVQRWRDAMWAKPKAHGMGHPGLGDKDFVQPERSMSAIGG